MSAPHSSYQSQTYYAQAITEPSRNLLGSHGTASEVSQIHLGTFTILIIVTILLLNFPHSFSSYTLCMLLPHAYYFLFTFLFPFTDFLFFHVQPYCLCVASCTVQLLMHSSAQSCTVCLLMHSLVTQYIRTG